MSEKKKSHGLSWIVGIGVAGAAGALWYGEASRAIPVDLAPARTQTIGAYIEERGQTALPRVYEITMPQDGRILPIELQEGRRVRAGDVVAQLAAILILATPAPEEQAKA